MSPYSRQNWFPKCSSAVSDVFTSSACQSGHRVHNSRGHSQAAALNATTASRARAIQLLQGRKRLQAGPRQTGTPCRVRATKAQTRGEGQREACTTSRNGNKGAQVAAGAGGERRSCTCKRRVAVPGRNGDETATRRHRQPSLGGESANGWQGQFRASEHQIASFLRASPSQSWQTPTPCCRAGS